MSSKRALPSAVSALVRWCSTVLTIWLFPLTAYRSPLTSQQAPARSAFQELRDSLTASSDTSSLRTLFRSSYQYQKAHRNDVEAALRLALVALRLGELRADADFGEAIASFRNLARRSPTMPEAWFGLGLAEEGRSAWETSVELNLGNRVGLRALERAGDNYTRALVADAGYQPAALGLAQVTLTLRDTARLADAVPYLQQAASAPASSPRLVLAWARVERAGGRPEASLGGFERYLALGENTALALLELARTRLAVGHPEGESAYYGGAALADAAVAAEYLSDIAPMLGEPEPVDPGSLTGTRLAEYLRHFWNNRDRFELRSEGERLREHYRRLQYARVHFPLTISRRFYGRLDAYRSGNTELDDRGIIYIRHGEPETRLRPFVFGAMPNESWRYIRAEGDLLLHFSAGWDQNGGGDLYDYRLVESVLDLRGAADAPSDQLLLSRQSLSPTYVRMLSWGRYGAARARAYERRIGSASIEAGTTTDTYELQFARRLPVIADLIAVGRSHAGSMAHFVYGIPAAETSPVIIAGEVRYPVRLRLVVLDALDRAAATLDTTFYQWRPRLLQHGEFLVGRAEITIPPGSWTYRASLQQGDSSGVVLPRGAVRVAPVDGSSLSLSDIALGTPGRAVTWVTDMADTVLLAPSAVFRKGLDIELYYEATGAVPGEVYRHEISVLRSNQPGSGAKRPLVALAFEEQASAPDIRSRRVVRLDRLKEGSYIVELKLTGSQGEVQARQRVIRLTK